MSVDICLVRAVTERKAIRTLREKRESRLWRRAPLRRYQRRPLPSSSSISSFRKAKRFALAKRLHPRLSSVITSSFQKEKRTVLGAFVFLEQVTRVRAFPMENHRLRNYKLLANFAKNDYQPFFIRKIPPWSSTLPHYLMPK